MAGIVLRQQAADGRAMTSASLRAGTTATTAGQMLRLGGGSRVVALAHQPEFAARQHR